MAQPAQKIWKTVEKNIITNEPSVIETAVDKLVEFVKPTLGPNIRHILVDHGYKSELSDDGVTIAEEFELEDEFEDAVASYVRQASRKTDDKAGDGTTTTMVLLQSLLKGISQSGKSYPEIKRELHAALEEAKTQLESMSETVENEEQLFKVAKTAMDDEDIAEKVANIIYQIGTNGAVTITDNAGTGVEIEKTEGFAYGRGMIMRQMANEENKFVAPTKTFPGSVGVIVVEDPLRTAEEIAPILQAANNESVKNLVIFAPNITNQALALLGIHQLKGTFNVVGIQLPGQGEKMKDFVADVCTVTGATPPVGEFEARNIGYCDRIEVTFDDFTIVGGQGDKVMINKAIDYLQAKVKESVDDYDKQYYMGRQARLYGGVAVIKVGGVTEAEVSLRIKKIEDAVNACKCALEAGICAGAGISLRTIKTSSEVVNNALQSVSDVVFKNAEMEIPELGGKETVNVLSGQKGNYLDVGVVDATKVLLSALENAVSIATILTTTSGIITSKRV